MQGKRILGGVLMGGVALRFLLILSAGAARRGRGI